MSEDLRVGEERFSPTSLTLEGESGMDPKDVNRILRKLEDIWYLLATLRFCVIAMMAGTAAWCLGRIVGGW